MKFANWKILTAGAAVTGLALSGTAIGSDDPARVDAIHLEDATTPAGWSGRDGGLLGSDGLRIGIDSPVSAASVDSVDSPDSPASPASPDSPSPASPASVDSPASPASAASPASPASAASPVSPNSPNSPNSPDSPGSVS